MKTPNIPGAAARNTIESTIGILTAETALRDGPKQAPRPSPRLADSLEIMGFLAEWNACCRAGG
jgi:hypothetical protein